MGGRARRRRARPVTKSVKAGLIFPVGKIKRRMKRYISSKRLTATAPVYMAAVLEYITGEMLSIAGTVTLEKHKKRISPRHILLCVHNDPEMKELLGHVTFAEAGVIPTDPADLIRLLEPNFAVGKKSSSKKAIASVAKKDSSKKGATASSKGNSSTKNAAAVAKSEDNLSTNTTAASSSEETLSSNATTATSDSDSDPPDTPEFFSSAPKKADADSLTVKSPSKNAAAASPRVELPSKGAFDPRSIIYKKPATYSRTIAFAGSAKKTTSKKAVTASPKGNSSTKNAAATAEGNLPMNTTASSSSDETWSLNTSAASSSDQTSSSNATTATSAGSSSPVNAAAVAPPRVPSKNAAKKSTTKKNG